MSGDDVTESGAVVAMLAASGQRPDDFTVFMGRLIERQHQDYAYTTSSLIDSLAREVAETTALVQLIGEAVDDLLSRPWAPSSGAIRACLYPDRESLATRAAEILAERGVHSSTHATHAGDE